MARVRARSLAEPDEERASLENKGLPHSRRAKKIFADGLTAAMCCASFAARLKGALAS
jgi:hypothetical protein